MIIIIIILLIVLYKYYDVDIQEDYLADYPKYHNCRCMDMYDNLETGKYGPRDGLV